MSRLPLRVGDPADVPAVFDRADAAISAAGSTTWELLCLGIPTAIIPVAENQRLIAKTVTAREAEAHSRVVAFGRQAIRASGSNDAFT